MATVDFGDWNYHANFDLARDRVRLAIGDTLADDQLVRDQEIAYAITTTGSENAAAIMLCEHLAARFARTPDETVTDSAGNTRTKSMSQRASGFLKLAAQLRETGAVVTTPMPFAGGISQSDMDTRAQDSDRVEPSFTIGMGDYL